MGRKMDALLRRGFRASKFKVLAKLALSRLAILKNQRQARCSTARSDVIQLLNLGQQDRAKQRVELVIKEQNMLDVFAMMEDFISLLTERITLLQDNKECPDELEEAISSLIFAATRCGDFPELKHIRETFTSRFGKDFAARAAELRNNCKVNPKIIQKLSTRQAPLENRVKMLKQIASESGIALDLEEEIINRVDELKEKQDVKPEEKQSVPHESVKVYRPEASDEINNLAEVLSESIKARKFRGVAAAAQEAFEAAAYAAAAARAAVELSRADSDDSDTDDGDRYEDQQLVVYGSTPEEIKNSEDESSSNKIHPNEGGVEEINNSENESSSNKIHPNESGVEEIKNSEDGSSSNKIHPNGSGVKNSEDGSGSDNFHQNDSSSSGGEAKDKEDVEVESYYSFKNMERKLPVSSTDSDNNTEEETTMAPNLQSQSEQCSDSEAAENQKSCIEEVEHHDLAIEHTEQNKDSDISCDDDEGSNDLKSSMDHPIDMKSRFESTQSFSDFGQKLCAPRSDRKLMSVRTIPVLRG